MVDASQHGHGWRCFVPGIVGLGRDGLWFAGSCLINHLTRFLTTCTGYSVPNHSYTPRGSIAFTGEVCSSLRRPFACVRSHIHNLLDGWWGVEQLIVEAGLGCFSSCNLVPNYACRYAYHSYNSYLPIPTPTTDTTATAFPTANVIAANISAIITTITTMLTAFTTMLCQPMVFPYPNSFLFSRLFSSFVLKYLLVWYNPLPICPI